jgi:hypothetical protein
LKNFNLPIEQLHAEFRYYCADLIEYGSFADYAGDVFAYYIGMVAAKNRMRARE